MNQISTLYFEDNTGKTINESLKSVIFIRDDLGIRVYEVKDKYHIFLGIWCVIFSIKTFFEILKKI